MVDFPTSLVDFQRRFPDEAACAAWLFEARLAHGLSLPACDHDKAWPHGGKAFTYECAACGRQTSVTAGTIMHGSKLPPKAISTNSSSDSTAAASVTPPAVRSSPSASSPNLSPTKC